MGTNDGPQLSNGCLHQKEYKQLNKVKKKDIYKARSFNFTFRFIDDVGSLQADDGILNMCIEMYGENLQLNKENQGTLSANVLDLTINIK